MSCLGVSSHWPYLLSIMGSHESLLHSHSLQREGSLMQDESSMNPCNFWDAISCCLGSALICLLEKARIFSLIYYLSFFCELPLQVFHLFFPWLFLIYSSFSSSNPSWAKCIANILSLWINISLSTVIPLNEQVLNFTKIIYTFFPLKVYILISKSFLSFIKL